MKIQLFKIQDQLEGNEETEKVFVGKSKWYSLMNLIRSQFEEKEDAKHRIDIARFAYMNCQE